MLLMVELIGHLAILLQLEVRKLSENTNRKKANPIAWWPARASKKYNQSYQLIFFYV